MRARRGFLRATACAAWAALAATARPAAAAPPPNVLVVVADDMGFSDAGCYGGEIATPNLDRLAADGLRFTQFYNTARCWPSRACILTGYYAQQVRRDALPGAGGGGQGQRPEWARLLPERLRPLGYRSYHSGKWHVDGQPLANGFDRSYSLEDHDRFFAPRNHLRDGVKLPPVAPGTDFYVTTFIADHAIECLKEHTAGHAGQPFFQYLCFTSPHFPLHARAEDIARYRGRYDAGWDTVRAERFRRQRELGLSAGALPPREPDVVPSWNLKEDELRRRVGAGEVGRAVAWDALTPEQRAFQSAKMAVHAAMVDRMDREIGRVLDQLRAMGAYTNTLVVFVSDNGASAEQIIRGDGHDPAAPPGSAGTFLGLGPGWSTAANTPFRLHKSWVHEGGICTPCIVHWPAGIAARGEWRHAPAHLIDLAPTIVELAGGRWPPDRAAADGAPPPPGRSLVPILARDAPLERDCLWWFHSGNRAVRAGDWKLVANGSGPWELYDLARDRTETSDLAGRHPDRVRELEALWTARMETFRSQAHPGGVPPPARTRGGK